MLKIWKINDSAGSLAFSIHFNGETLPNALPWIEPSINCLHQESVMSYLVGNFECAIMSMCALLEHTLRLAVINKEECGLKRPDSVSKMDKYNSLANVIVDAKGTDIFDGCNENWWDAVSQNIRNKSAHYLLPSILQRCAQNEELKKYISDYELPDKSNDWYYKKYIADWGSFYHKAGGYLAQHFLSDATEELRTVISNTNWVGDESWWISQKQEYEAFFSYDWNIDNVKQSFEDVYKERKM